MFSKLWWLRTNEKKWVKAIVNPFRFKKKSKKKKKNLKRNTKTTKKTLTLSSNGGGIIGGDTALLFEILSRVPALPLMRFKSVCKQWLFFIEQDPYFINLQRSRSETQFVIMVHKFDPNRKNNVCNLHSEDIFLTANLLLKQRNMATSTTTEAAAPAAAIDIHTTTKIKYMPYQSITKPVNGLIGFMNSKSVKGACVYNIATKEEMPWIRSKLVETERQKYGKSIYFNWFYANCQLGMDPATNEHKLVCIWNISRSDLIYNVCEVLTVARKRGNNTWRRIEEVPPDHFSQISVYVNGSIYWTTHALWNQHWDIIKRPVCILAFDMGSEKFREIPIPDFILNQPRDYDDLFCQTGIDLLEVGGRVGLLVRMSGHLAKLWIFDNSCDDKKKAYSTTTTSSSINASSEQNWSELTITLPFYWGRKHRCRVYFHSVAGKDDQIMLTRVNERELVSFYCYNWKKNSFMEFGINEIPSSVPDINSAILFSTFEGGLLPIQSR